MTKIQTTKWNNGNKRHTAEVSFICNKDVISVDNQKNKAFFIRANTGWIVMSSQGFSGDKRSLLEIAEAALEENIREHVSAVVFLQPVEEIKNEVRVFLQEGKEELAVFGFAGVSDAEILSDIAYYEVRRSGAYLVDGVELGLVVDTREDVELGFYLKKYQVFQPGSRYERKAVQAQERKDREVSLQEILRGFQQEVLRYHKSNAQQTFLLEVREQGEYAHYAIKLAGQTLDFEEVEEEFGDYFWKAELPIVQITKAKLQELYDTRKATANLYAALVGVADRTRSYQLQVS